MWWIGAVVGMLGLLTAVFSPHALIDMELSFAKLYIRTRWFWPVLIVAMLVIGLVNWGLGDLPTLDSILSSAIFNVVSGAAFGSLILYVPEVIRLRTFYIALRGVADATTLTMLLIKQYPGDPHTRLQAFDTLHKNGMLRVDSPEADRLRNLLK